jgi:glucose dehydrogenase
MNDSTQSNSPRVFPILLFFIATLFILGGLQLIFLGGSFYYLLAGLALAASGYRLKQADPSGSLIYGVFLLATVVNP